MDFVPYVRLSQILRQPLLIEDMKEPTPLIVFTPDDDNTDWQKDGE